MAGLEDAAGLGWGVWWHSRTSATVSPRCAFLPRRAGSPAAPSARREPGWLCLGGFSTAAPSALTSGVAPALKVILHCCSRSFETHLFKIAGEWLEKVLLNY